MPEPRRPRWDLGFPPLGVQPGSLRLFPFQTRPGHFSPRAVTFGAARPKKRVWVPSWVSQREEPPLPVPHPSGTLIPGFFSRVFPEFFLFPSAPGQRGAVALPGFVTFVSPELGFVTCRMWRCRRGLGDDGVKDDAGSGVWGLPVPVWGSWGPGSALTQIFLGILEKHRCCQLFIHRNFY